MLALRKRHIGAAAVMAISLSLTLSACGGSDSAAPADSATASAADEAVVALVPADLTTKAQSSLAPNLVTHLLK